MREEVGGGELGSSEAMVEDEVKLCMMCWNVCGRCKEGSRMEQMREGIMMLGQR